MKKILLVLGVTIVLSANCIAQSGNFDNREAFRFGIKAGANLLNVYDSKGEAFNASAKVGMAGGIFFIIPFGKLIGVQLEIMFSQKGFQATGQLLGNSYDFTRTTNYIELPVFLTIKPTSFLTLVAGPQFSYLLKQKDVYNNGVTSVAQQTIFNNDNIRKNILCFVGGANINIKHMVLGVRAGWDVQNNNGDGTTTTPRYKNMWYQATLGYIIGFN